jgi:type IV pilus assembly protein PilN
MMRVNLLPHREAARKARRQQFFSLIAMVAVLGGLVVFLVYSIINGYIGNQEEKNDFLKKEIAILDKQIDQIKRLKEQTDALLNRKRAIETLQRGRGETVYLLSELVKQVPEGVYLKSIKQDNAKVMLSGYVQSNARVSTLMRNLEASPWLERPELLEIKAVTVDKRRLNEFNMNVYLTRPKAEDSGKAGAKTGSSGGKDQK